MNTAIKIAQSGYQSPESETTGQNTALAATVTREKNYHPSGMPGKNTRRLMMILEQESDQTEVFALLGWDDLPQSLKEAVRLDMEAYRDELLGLYSSCDKGVKNRRKRVSYWIKAYREGICSEETALNALSETTLV